MKRFLAITLSLILALSLAGCRIRTTAETMPNQGVEENSEDKQGSSLDETKDEPKQDEIDKTEDPIDGAPTENDPESNRKEFSEDADAEVTPDVDNKVISGEKTDGDTTDVKDIVDADGDKTLNEVVSAEVADNLGASDNAPEADSLMTYYSVLIEDRLNSLFECKRLYIYWEKVADYDTIYKTSVEHQLILDAGAYDVSARLLEENLHVTADWIKNKNPEMVVKVVSPDILGKGVVGTAAAKAYMDSLMARDEISGSAAAKNAHVMLISSDLLTSNVRRTGAALFMAKEMFPDLFDDLDAEEALRLLTEEVDGSALNGTFVYSL